MIHKLSPWLNFIWTHTHAHTHILELTHAKLWIVNFFLSLSHSHPLLIYIIGILIDWVMERKNGRFNWNLFLCVRWNFQHRWLNWMESNYLANRNDVMSNRQWQCHPRMILAILRNIESSFSPSLLPPLILYHNLIVECFFECVNVTFKLKKKTFVEQNGNV